MPIINPIFLGGGSREKAATNFRGKRGVNRIITSIVKVFVPTLLSIILLSTVPNDINNEVTKVGQY